MKTKTYKLAVLIMGLFLFGSFVASAQILNAPDPIPDPNGNGTSPWGSACASSSFNDYWVNFTWINAPAVNADNKFILELSDATGSFAAPVELVSFDDKNAIFDFDMQFSIPTNTRGENYKLRVKSTSPEKFSPESGPYPMYYIDFASPILMSQDGDGNIPSSGKIEICDGGTITLSPHNVPNKETYQYNWYRSGTLLAEKSETLIVADAGMYSVQIDYGSCAGSGGTDSNIIDVVTGTKLGVAINPPSNTSLCSGDTAVLEANITNQGLTYTWYKDDVAITSPTVDDDSYAVDASVVGFEGDYTVQIEGTNVCVERSTAITITSASSLVVTRDNDANMVILPGQTKTLQVTSSDASVDYEWYKDGVIINGETNNTLNVTAEGVYFARVSQTGGNCFATIDSESTTVVAPVSFELTINYATAYTACQNTSIALEVQTINAIDAGGASTDVTADLLNTFTYQWQKDGVDVSGETASTLSLTDITENGDYQIIGSVPNYSDTTSNTLTIQLLTSETVTISADSNTFCDVSNPINISTTTDLTGETYAWLKDGVSINTTDASLSITETGTYVLEITKNGCPLRSNEVVVVPFDDSLITMDADIPVILLEGQTRTVTASGGDSYRWMDTNNVEISNTASVDLSAEGSYMLIASIGTCTVTKPFTVSFRETFNIPNAVTPNGDGKNDLWVLPNTYSNQSDVRVIIYNSNGTELLNQTNYQNNWPSSSMSFPKQNMVFFYKIIDAQNKQKQGTITIIR